MRIKIWVLCVFLSHLLILFADSHAETSKPSVYSDGGNIFLATDGKSTPLTNTGMDSEPVLSPDGRWVAFNREIEGKVKECSERDDLLACPSDELWIFDLEKRSERLLLQPREDAPKVKAEEVIEKFYGKMFSPGNKTIYFSTPTYATASAIHAVDVDGKDARFVTAGSLVWVIHEPLSAIFKEYIVNILQEDDWRIRPEKDGYALVEKALKDDVTGYLIMEHSGIKINNTPTLLDHGWEGDDGKYYVSGGRRVWDSLDSPDGSMRIPIGKEQ